MMETLVYISTILLLLQEELATSIVRSTLQQDKHEYLVREKVAGRLEATEDGSSYKRQEEVYTKVNNVIIHYAFN